MQNYVGKQIDRYRIIERLGMGGMAVVYKAYDTRLERDVALKLIRTEAIPPEQYDRLMKRFEREAKSQARFDHKNIVHIYDYGEVDGSPYLVMAYVSGGTLKDRLHEPVDWRQAVQWLIPVAEALSYAHQRGIVHRDVKPANILFDEEDQPVLTDFGIAKVLETDEATLTGTGLGVGTPEYMAPEQWQGQTSEATDQYALGVVLYELITGRKPYSADTPAAIILMQATEPLAPPSGLVQGIPAAVEKVLYKALARNPEDRYENMDAFAKALRGLLAETAEPVLPNQTAQPMEPLPEVTEATHSEGVTRDALDATPTEGIPQQIGSGKKKKKGFPKWISWAFGGIVGLVLITLAFNLGSKSANPRTSSIVPEVKEPTTASTETSAPTMTATITLTLEPTLGIGSTRINEIDGAEMVYIFPGYWFYKYEVTNRQYLNFVTQTNYISFAEEHHSGYVSTGPGTASSDQSASWYAPHGEGSNIDEIMDHPVVQMTWFDANAYCLWAEGRLPTEAEWVIAQGGRGQNYPWGNLEPTCQMGNFNGCVGSTTSVGSYPTDISPAGIFDLFGNVVELVQNGYDIDENYETDVEKVFYRLTKGNSWNYGTYNTNYSEGWVWIEHSDDTTGFRCIVDIDK